MMKWLKKFVLDIMPSIAATIIGAYIVNHYIIPKSPAANQASVSSSDSKSTEAKPVSGGADKASVEKASFEKAVADKTAIEKTAEKAASDKAAAAEKASDNSLDTASVEARKHHPAPKTIVKPSTANATPAAVPDERRANDLARAAIDRLRSTGTSESVKADPVKIEAARTEASKTEISKAPEAPRVQTVTTIASAPPMQPLPPAINVTTPNPDVFEQGNAAPVVRQPYPQVSSHSDEAPRLAPPADIPLSSRPMDLRAEASTPRTSVADDVVSAAKSMFHAVIPR